MEHVSTFNLHQLLPVSADLAKAVSASWWPQIEDLRDDDVRLVSKYQRLIDWAVDYSKGITRGEHLYAVVRTADSHPKALVELVHTSNTKEPYLKFLNLYFEPRLDTLGVGEEGFSEVIDTIAAAITHAIGLIFDELPSYQLKVYGRGDEMKRVCDALKEVINDKTPRILEADGHGQWLVISKSKTS